ncbi:MAG TPA: hypothetical protein PLZ55_11450, partial [bacterium]|nr:hypothetical protein [bacterium]
MFLLAVIVFFVPCLAFASVGGLDCTFGTCGMAFASHANNYAQGDAMAIYTSGTYTGKFVVAGTVEGSGGTDDFCAARFNSNGSLDTSFYSTGWAPAIDFSGSYDRPGGVAVYSGGTHDGKVVVVGSANISSKDNLAVVRYNADGSLDTTFGSSGLFSALIGGTSSYWTDVVIDSSNKIYVVGTISSNLSAIVRLNENGGLDTSFSTDGIQTVNVSTAGSQMEGFVSVALSGSSIWAGGWACDTSGDNWYQIVKFDTSGNLDTSFSGDGILMLSVNTGSHGNGFIAVQTDGKVLIGGYADDTNNVRDFGIARVNTDGSLDTTFSGDGKVLVDVGGSSDELYGLAVQSDGKIVAVGVAYDFGIVRLNSDGSLDTTFGNGGKNLYELGDDDRPYAGVVIQSDGKIVSGGWSGPSDNRKFALTRTAITSSAMSYCAGITTQPTTTSVMQTKTA